jgi:hypothetical protein
LHTDVPSAKGHMNCHELLSINRQGNKCQRMDKLHTGLCITSAYARGKCWLVALLVDDHLLLRDFEPYGLIFDYVC